MAGGNNSPDLGQAVGAGKPAPTPSPMPVNPYASPSPGVNPAASPAAGSNGAPLITQADILAFQQAQQAASAKTVSSYDQRNNFAVPLTPPNMQYSGGVLSKMAATMPYDTAINSGFLSVTDPNLQRLVADAAGGDPIKYDTVWRAAVQRAALAKQGGDINSSVEGILMKWGKSGLPTGVSSGNGGGPFHTVNRTVSLSDEGTANQIINNPLTRYLGRTATDVEQKMFLKALNIQEKQNPTVTSTSGTTSGRNTNESTTTTGGFNRDDFAERFAKSQEGYAEYQTATTYLDAFMNALNNPTRAI
jgi:hypothetical protein